MKFYAQINVCILFILFLSITATASYEDVMGFETAENIWVSETDMSEFDISVLWCERVPGTYNQLRNSVELSTEYVKQGQYSLKWARHNEFPTLATTEVPSDWSEFNTVRFWAYSEVETNQQIYFVVHSDSDETEWKDFYYKPLTVDWTGWKEIDIPLSSFNEYESVAGFDKVDGVGFYCKLFYAVPNPYTVIYLDDMRLLDIPAADINRDGVVNILDFSSIHNQWGLKLVVSEDFEEMSLGSAISQTGWAGYLGASTEHCISVQSNFGGKQVAVVYGEEGGRYRKSFSGNNLTDSDENIYVSADITPISYGGVCYDIWAGFWAQWFPGIYVGFQASAEGNNWKPAVTLPGGSSVISGQEYVVKSGDTYRLRLQIETSAPNCSLYIKNLTEYEANFTLVQGIEDKPLTFTSSNDPTKWVRVYMELYRNGAINNIVLGSGKLSDNYPPLLADFNSDRVVDLLDLKQLVTLWLNI